MGKDRVMCRNMVGGWVLEVDGEAVPVMRTAIAAKWREALVEASDLIEALGHGEYNMGERSVHARIREALKDEG